jgi:hypothetical protein
MLLALAALLYVAHAQTCSERPKGLTLTYFDAAGRAEAARLAFHIGDIPFKDERLSREQFQVS